MTTTLARREAAHVPEYASEESPILNQGAEADPTDRHRHRIILHQDKRLPAGVGRIDLELYDWNDRDHPDGWALQGTMPVGEILQYIETEILFMELDIDKIHVALPTT